MTELKEGSISGRAQPGSDTPILRDDPDDRPRRPLWPVAVVAIVVALGAGIALALPRVQHTTLSVTGLDDGVVLNEATASSLAITVEAGGMGAGDVTVSVDGVPLTTGEAGDRIVARPEDLADGDHVLTVVLDGRYGADGETVTRRFRVDASGPWFSAPTEMLPVPEGDRLIVTGLVDGATTLTVDGLLVPIDQGAYRIELPPRTAPIEIVARDDAGNSTTHTVTVTSTPTPADYPATNAVHVGQSAWADPVRRAAIIELARTGQVNAVQLDIKDEVGDLGYPSSVPLATTIGAKMDFYDARASIDELHALGVKVIGRIVCFLDPTLARWAHGNGEPNYLVYDGTGTTPLPSDDYGDAAFTNLADADVQQYQIDLAVEAAELGFDEIIYDYVRRPEGDLTTMTFPGLESTPEIGVAWFVERTRQALDPLGVELGVSVFGVSATRPHEIGQDIRLLAPLVDYVSPMVYPEGWGDGEYGVADPYNQPYDIVLRSLADFHHLVAGSGAAVVPWLQDYSVGQTEYTELHVAAQILATKDAGSNGYLMWNPRGLYHGAAIQPIS